MAQLMDYGQHYDRATGIREQWKRGLEDDKCPLNHIMDHLCAYELNEAHDKMGDRKGHLAAIAVNAMFEYFFEARREAQRLAEEKMLDETLNPTPEPEPEPTKPTFNIIDVLKNLAGGRVQGDK